MLRWLAGALLIGFSLYVCVCNVVYRSYFRHERHSLVFLVGGLVGMAGLLVLPMPGIHGWFLVPIIADVGIPYLVGFGFAIGKNSSRR